MLRPRRLAPSLLFAALLLAAAGVRPAAAQTFHRIPLPTTLGDVSTLFYSDIVAASGGNAVATRFSKEGDGTYLYHWSVEGGGHVIGRFAAFIDRVSSDGRVVVFHGNRDDGQQAIWRWTREGGVVEVAHSGPGSITLDAVSDDGGQIVYVRRTDNPMEGFCTREGGPCRQSNLSEVFVWSAAQGERRVYSRTNSRFRDDTGATRISTYDVEEHVVEDVSNDGAFLYVRLRKLLRGAGDQNLSDKHYFAQLVGGALVPIAEREQALVGAASETGDVIYSSPDPSSGFSTWASYSARGTAPSTAHLTPSAYLLAATRSLGGHVYVLDANTSESVSVRIRDTASGAETVLSRPGKTCYPTAGLDSDELDDAVVLLNCYANGQYAGEVWTRAGGARPLLPLLRAAARADSALINLYPNSLMVTGAAIYPRTWQRGVDAWVVSMTVPRLVVRDVARFGKASTPIAGVEVTIEGNVTVVATTGPDGTIAIPDANSAGGFDPAQPATVRLRDTRTGLRRTYQPLRLSDIADTTLTLPVDLVRRLSAAADSLATSGVPDLPILRQIGDALLAYDTTRVADLRGVWFGETPQTPAIYRRRDEHLGRLVASLDGLVTLHASEKPLANQVASVGVQAVTTLLSGKDAIQQIEDEIAVSNVFASGGGEVLRGIALAVTQAGNSGLHSAYLAFTGTVEQNLPSPWNTAWSWLGEAATKGVGDGIASRSAGDGGSAFLSTLVETVVEKTAGPLVDAVYIGQTQDDLDAAARHARTFAGQGTPRAGFETSLTRANESAARLDARLSLSTAVLATAKGWADVGDLALVIGKVPGAQVAATMGLLIRSFSFGALAADEVLSVRALHRAASSDSPSLVALAYGLPPVAGAAPDLPGPTAARAASLAMGQATAGTVVPALDRYAAHLGAVRTSVQTGTRDAARVATDSLLRADSGLRRALDQTHAELSALAPASDAMAAAQRRLLGRTGVLSGDGLRLYAGLLPHLIPALAADPDGVSNSGPLDGPMTGIADTVLARIPRVRVALDSLRAAFEATQIARSGLTAPPTLVVTDPGVALPVSVAPGALTIRARITNAGSSAADGVMATLVADGDTTGAPAAVLRLTSAAAQSLGTLAPGQTVEATWTLAARDTSALGRGSSGLYRIETASTTAGAVARRAVQRVGVSASTGVGIEGESAVALSGTGIEAIYPNPARQSVLLRYTLAAPSRVGVRVYDTLGREVARVADGEQAVGRHTATLDLSALAAGVYVVRVDAGGASSTRVVTVVR